MQLRIEYYDLLRKTLAKLFYRREDAEAIAIHLKLNLSITKFSFKSLETFSSIVALAEFEGKIGLLFEAAFMRKEGDKELLNLKGAIDVNGYLQNRMQQIGFLAYIKGMPVNIVIVYAPPLAFEISKVKNHLSAYVHQDFIHIFDIHEVNDETNFQVALIMITPELMGSDMAYLFWIGEVRKLGMKIIPVLINPCEMDRCAVFTGRVTLPKNGFINDRAAFANEDLGFVEMAKSVFRIVDKMNGRTV